MCASATAGDVRSCAARRATPSVGSADSPLKEGANPSPPSSIAAAASSRGSPRRFAGGLEAGKRRPSPTPPGRPARARAEDAQSPTARGGARRFRWMGSPDAGGEDANAGRCGRGPAGMRRIRATRRGIDARAGPAAGGDGAAAARDPSAGRHLAWARGERGKAPGGGRARPVAGRRSRAPTSPWRTALREGEEARKWPARQLSGAARSPRAPSRGRGAGAGAGCAGEKSRMRFGTGSKLFRPVFADVFARSGVPAPEKSGISLHARTP